MELSKTNNQDLDQLVCDLTAKNPKDQETINFLVDIASRKFKLDKDKDINWSLQQEECSIRIKALEGLRDVDLTINQLLRIMGQDYLYEEMLRKAVKSSKKLVRLRALRLMFELKKANRLSPLMPGLINAISSAEKLTDGETSFLNTILDTKHGVEVNEVQFNQYVMYGAKDLCLLLSDSKTGRLSWEICQIIKECYPRPEDSLEQFSHLVSQYQVSKEQLVNIVFIAPQWKPFIAHAIDKRRFLEAVDWINHVGYSFDIGTKDISDFRLDLGEELWELLLHYSSVAWNPREKKIYTLAISGKIEMEELIEKYNTMDLTSHSRARKFIIAIGFLPLKPEPDRTKDIVRRYQFLKDYIRQSNQYGRYRFKLNERAGLRALKVLAGIAGYSDRKTFELAMETEAVKDLAVGPVVMSVNGYEISLSLTDQGSPAIEVFKAGKLIKSIPDKLKNHEDIIALKKRVKQIRRSASRLRLFLEEAMVKSVEYTPTDFLGLMSHPILKPMMGKLIFVSKNGMGYPIGTTLKLSSYDETEITVDDDDQLKIAHPHDLLQSGKWEQWQHECFLSGRIQPFKQVFRELYIVTDEEKNEEHVSQRFIGHQVSLGQSLTLFETREWHYDWDGGIEIKIWKKGSCCNACTLLLLPYGIEDLGFVRVIPAFTCSSGNIMFYSKGRKVPIEDVSPIFFSETMRDIDLFVSVAHVKESPWESSTSTVESRAALARETCQLLQLGNVRIEDHFAMVDGTLASYKVHLGSGSIHQVPGNYVCVIPDNTKFQGKLFLPFIDKDEMTSIILSKIILLAHDEKIKDPVILNQIKRSG